MEPQKHKPYAVVTIYRAPEMTKRGRAKVARWLRKQADLLENDWESLPPYRHTARWLDI